MYKSFCESSLAEFNDFSNENILFLDVFREMDIVMNQIESRSTSELVANYKMLTLILST